MATLGDPWRTLATDPPPEQPQPPYSSRERADGKGGGVNFSSFFSVRVHPTLFVGWTLGSQPIPAKRSQAPSQARPRRQLRAAASARTLEHNGRPSKMGVLPGGNPIRGLWRARWAWGNRGRNRRLCPRGKKQIVHERSPDTWAASFVYVCSASRSPRRVRVGTGNVAWLSSMPAWGG